MTTIKAINAKAGQTIRIREAYRHDIHTLGALTVKVSADPKYGQFQSWDDGGIYIHGERDDGYDGPTRVYDLADVEVVS